MRRLAIALCISLSAPAAAEVIVPVRTIRAKEVITAADITWKPTEIPGAISDPAAIIGQEARISLYPGRPVRPGDVGPPALVERNDLVSLVYTRGTLRISAEGRVLGRGSVGERVRVMNLTSRTTVSGQILPDGSIEVR